MQKEIISIVNEVLDKHLKGDLEVAVDLSKIDKEYRGVCEKLNFLLDSEKIAKKPHLRRNAILEEFFYRSAVYATG